MSETVIDEGLKIEDIRYQVMNYVRSKLPVYKTWSDDNLNDLIKFYMDLGQCLISEGNDGNIDGVLALQFVDKVEDRNVMENKRDGEGVFIDIFIAKTKQVREKLVWQAISISGVRKWIAFERCKYGQRASKLPWKFAERIASYGW
jgi:hypothetical protein